MPEFHNWGRTASCNPTRILQPANEAEVVELVRQARIEGTHIKVVGAAHSWSDIAMTDHWLLNLDRMGEILHVDREKNHVRMQAGIRLKELNRQLHELGLALTILGSVAEQSIAGVVSTGTHGSSRVHGNLSSFVVAMRLVTGTGEILELAEGDPRLPSLRVGLGAGAIITEVTLTVEPAFVLEEHGYPLPFEQALASMKQLVEQHEYIKFWWFPHTDRIQVYTYTRTDKTRNLSAFASAIDERVLNPILFPLVLALGNLLPFLIPVLNRIVATILFSKTQRVGRSFEMFTVAMPPVHRESEWAIPSEHVVEALRRIHTMVQDEHLRVNFIQEIRFVPADENWMSPAYGRATCQLGVYCSDSPNVDRFFEGSAAILRDLHGRPHWGKEFDTNPREISERLPRAKEFAELVRTLDPDGVFRNAFTDRVLGTSDR